MVAATPLNSSLVSDKFFAHVVKHLLALLADDNLRPQVHFELEGTVQLQPGVSRVDYHGINQALVAKGIAGSIKPEYWRNQWEYVSDFAGQSPLQEAVYLQRAMACIPKLMCRHGAQRVLMQPISWQGDSGRYAQGSGTIFSTDQRSVHIPNAIQLNISVLDERGDNLIAHTELGEWLQHQLLMTSYACCALFLPEEDAFRRLTLRENYDLDDELSSPVRLSGGYRGSIALYRQKGKHDQPMGQEPLLYASDQSVLTYQQNWQKSARIEHRLGATSRLYNPMLNVIFVLLNLLDALVLWRSGEPPPQFVDRALPVSLKASRQDVGAIQLFQQNNWFSESIDHYCQTFCKPHFSPGEQIKQYHLNAISRLLDQRSI